MSSLKFFIPETDRSKNLNLNPKKMKFFTFTITLVLFSFISTAQSPTCANYFKRNNGNGTCPDGQLRLYYSDCPTVTPIIDSVYADGIKSVIVFAEPDLSKCASLGFISYCVVGGNMPPAALWKIYFHSTGSAVPFSCIVPEGSVLPIGVKSFDATRSANTVVLNWETAYEANGQSIQIQKKSGSKFVTVGSVPATNNITGDTYTFTDKNTSFVVTEYRLRLLSKDAEEGFSEVRAVKAFGAAPEFTLYPNPAVSDATISITDINGPTDVQIFDNAGRIVKTITINNATPIQLNNLQVGIYRVRMVNKMSGASTIKTLTVIQ